MMCDELASNTGSLASSVAAYGTKTGGLCRKKYFRQEELSRQREKPHPSASREKGWGSNSTQYLSTYYWAGFTLSILMVFLLVLN